MRPPPAAPVDLTNNRDLYRFCAKAGTAKNGGTNYVNCVPDLEGRYVYMYVSGSAHLVICEFEVYAGEICIPHGMYCF